MTPRRIGLSTALVVFLTTPVAAQDSGGFIVRLGRDTTSVESYSRSAGRLVVDQVGRAPRVLKRHYEYEFDATAGATRASATIAAPEGSSSPPPVQKIEATFSGDSLTMESRRDTVVQRVRLPMSKGLMPNANASPWSVYDLISMRTIAAKVDSLRVPIYGLGGNALTRVTVRKLGADSVAIETDNDGYRAQVDKSGRILHVIPIRGTQRFSVDRSDGVNLAALTASFLAREQQGQGMGPLSTRDTTRATAGGANLWIDYGRPAKRGRVIFGTVVPWGELW